jgi:hypothetical protein
MAEKLQVIDTYMVYKWLTWNHLSSKQIKQHLHRTLLFLVLLQRPRMQPAKHL